MIAGFRPFLFSKGGLVFNTKRHRLHDEEFEKALLLLIVTKNFSVAICNLKLVDISNFPGNKLLTIGTILSIE